MNTGQSSTKYKLFEMPSAAKMIGFAAAMLLAALIPPTATAADTLTVAEVDSMARHYLALVVAEDNTAALPPTLGRSCSETMLPGAAALSGTQESKRLAPGPRRRPWLAVAEVVGINVFVQSFDRFILNEEFAKINFKTIGHNFETGFVWDNDQFSTNLFAHPYHGGLYFNAARTNGMNFWESVPYAFGGSLMWETMGEIEPPAINDLIATTMGGVAIGEVTNRISSLVYDDSKRGFQRFAREFLGTVICPIRGLNRIISGDAWRVRHTGNRYHDYEKLPVSLSLAAGYRYLADDNALFRGETSPFVNVDLVYGDPFDESQNKPYDYFTADVTFNLASNQPLISGIHLLGQLWSAPVYSANGMQAEFGFFQHFNYYDSQPVKDGSSMVPFRISEAASVGPGIIYQFPATGSLSRLEQRIFGSAILLGGSLSDHYNIIDRDYNMGSGFSAKVQTLMEFGSTAQFFIDADYYRIYTWKGYEGKDLATVDPLYLNAQGDKGDAQLLVVSPRIRLALSEEIAVDMSAFYYARKTHYKYLSDVRAKTFTIQMGIAYRL
ncbi:MAG: DUF3943 domain-containing protein [Prevotella sp.]